MAKTEIFGVKEVKKLLEDVGKAPAKVLTKAAKSGAKIVQADAKANAPVDTGNLKRGIKLKTEKRRKYKRVYEIGFFGKGGKGEEFVKIGKNGKRSFYPVSQEYGWVDKSGKKHPGKRFLRNAVDHNRERVKNEMLTVMGTEIDKLK